MRPLALRIAVLACASAAHPDAHADVNAGLQAELRLGAGYDDNLFLDANPSGLLPAQIHADAIFDFEPRLSARLAPGRNRLVLVADFLERLTLSTGDLRDLTVRAGWDAPPLGPVRLIAAARYEYYGSSLFPDDTFHLGGGEAGLRIDLLERLRLEASYRVDARLYPDPARRGQLDLEQRAIGALHLNAHRLVTLDLGYLFLHLSSTEAAAELERHRADVTLTVRPVSWLLIAADYGLGYEHLPGGVLTTTNNGPRNDFLQAADGLVAARPLAWLELFVRYTLIDSSSPAPGGQYRRNQVLAGLSLIVDQERTWKAHPPEAPVERDRRVTFRFRGAARRVSVIGDWNGWNPEREPLALVGGASFAGSFVLPPGRHEYALSVDGVARRPPDAPAYRADGFGGVNGVIEVR